MWSVYGDKGVAVKTSLSRLKDALPPMPNIQIQGINYVDRMSCADRCFRSLISEHPSLLLRPDFLKTIEYEHEKELRVAVACQKGEKGLMIHGIKAESLVQEVVISPLLPMAEIKAIEILLTKAYCFLNFTHSTLTDASSSMDLFDDYNSDEPDDLPNFLKTPIAL